MPTWKEQHFERNLSLSAPGLGVTRGWNVIGLVPDAARADPQAPKFRDQHPEYSDLVVNSVIFSPTGFGTKVTAQYVPIEYVDIAPIENNQDIDFQKIDSRSKNIDIEIGIFQRITKEFPAPGGTTVTKKVWQPSNNKVTFRYSVMEHRLTVNAIVSTGPGVLGSIALADQAAAQHNKIHTIGGKKYLFQMDGSKRLAVDKYQFNYLWISDPGIKDTLVYDLSASPSFGIIGTKGYPRESLTGPHAGFLIGPFRRLDTSPDDSDPTLPPLVNGSPAYEEDPTGHLTLPGIA